MLNTVVLRKEIVIMTIYIHVCLGITFAGYAGCLAHRLLSDDAYSRIRDAPVAMCWAIL